jgi:hypothetical protein
VTEARPQSPIFDRAIKLPLIAAIGALLLLAVIGGIGWSRAPGQLYSAWLFAWIFWLGISLGSIGVVMMHHLLGGGWGHLIRRFGEAAGACMPLLAILFLPILIGAKWIYPWMDKALVNSDAVLRYKHASYLNWPFWTVRTVIVLMAFIVMGLLIQTRALDRAGARASLILGRIRRASAGGLVVYFFLMTLGSIDWIMSREPHWQSSVFGFIVCLSQAVSATCFLIMMLYLFRNAEPIQSMLDPNYLIDLGNVLLTFVIMWSYLSFAQFLVIWLGNSQGEITWYIRRTHGGWRWVGAALILFHFLIPFLILLHRPLKRTIGRLAAIAAAVFVIHIVDEIYWITPADVEPGVRSMGQWALAQLLNGLAFIAVGGLWLAAFFWILQKRPLTSNIGNLPTQMLNHEDGRTTTSPPIE